MRQLGIALVTSLSLGLAAQSVPTTLNYQGRLTDNTPAQAPVNATVPMAFAIWDAAGAGSKLWQEPASGGTNVLVVNGIFNVALGGNGVAIPPSVFTGATSTRYLEITMNPGAPGAEILAPRQVITSGGYANLAQNANSALTAATATTASSVTNGVYTTGSYADPAWITSLSSGKLSGTVGTGSGGTGISAAPTAAGQFLRSTGAGAWGVGTIQPADVPAAGGATSQNFASLYRATSFAVIANGALLFDSTVAINGLGYNAATGTVTVTASGLYLVTYSVYCTTNNREVALQVNGITVAGSRGVMQSNMYTTLSIMVTMFPGDTLRLVNTSGAAITIGSATPGQTAASLNIVRIQ